MVSCILTLFVIASVFAITQCLQHGSRLSHFTSFLVFLPQQCVRGLCCGCEHHRGTCNSLSRDWKTGLGLPQPLEMGHVHVWDLLCPDLQADIISLSFGIFFPFLYLAGIVFWRWFSLSLLPGREVVCKLITAPFSPLCWRSPAVGEGKGWLTLPAGTPMAWVASPGGEVSSAGRKGCGESGTESQDTVLEQLPKQTITYLFTQCPPMFPALSSSPVLESVLLCAEISPSKGCQKENQPNKGVGALSHDTMMPVQPQREQRWNKWLEDRGTPPRSASRKQPENHMS